MTAACEATDRDLAQLQGTWKQMRFEDSGVVNPSDSSSAPNALMTIDRHHFSVQMPGGKLLLEGCFELDVSTEPPSIT